MSYKDHQPDYNNLLQVLYNQRPKRLPLYEHIIDISFVEKFLGVEFEKDIKTEKQYENYFKTLTTFWKNCTFDAFAYEAVITEILPDHGAIYGGKGPIQTRIDFENYPFEKLPHIYWEKYTPQLNALKKSLPDGMKAYGGCGNGIFEVSQDLVGYESLCMMQYLDPDLFRDIFIKIGDLFVQLWSEMINKYGDIFVFHRMGDDLGYKNSTMLEPDTIRTHIMPQYKRVIDIVHNSGKKFLLHSCGNIFEIMDDIIDLGIDAKHSNEDIIALFSKWIDLYSNRIGLFGGIDVNTLCMNSYENIYNEVLEKGIEYRAKANGYGLGSGNSIADFVPVEGFQAMIDAVNEIRRLESH